VGVEVVDVSITIASAEEVLQVLKSDVKDWKESKARSVTASRDDADFSIPVNLAASSGTTGVSSVSLGAGFCKSDITLATNFGLDAAFPPVI
jgi:hypothetical protein